MLTRGLANVFDKDRIRSDEERAVVCDTTCDDAAADLGRRKRAQARVHGKKLARAVVAAWPCLDIRSQARFHADFEHNCLARLVAFRVDQFEV